ncbi:MAG TPA: ABC transporter ATP-binding protein, partial [Gammaproteobacteria bacterium]|nr:ABC transporter ATP-binding protein [Gammaproteobacteria bacterium]
YALFPHMTVRENVAFASGKGARVRPEDLLERLGIAHLGERRPARLSGGEQQRVALARALAAEPEVLLLDEPLSSLDLPAREALRLDLPEILAGATAVYVTHDRTEARLLGDRVAVIRDGAIRQCGPVPEVFERPADPFVAAFTGSNVVPVADLPEGAAGRGGGHLAVRPEHLRLEENGPGPRARVLQVIPEGPLYRVTLRLGAASLHALTAAPPEEGSEVSVAWCEGRAHRI